MATVDEGSLGLIGGSTGAGTGVGTGADVDFTGGNVQLRGDDVVCRFQ